MDSEETNKPATETEEGNEYEDEVSGHILNLSGAFNSLMEVDSGLLSKVRQAKMAKMKRQIFDALVYYCECLPEPEKKDEPKAESNPEED